jgi:hypothetical protein
MLKVTVSFKTMETLSSRREAAKGCANLLYHSINTDIVRA